MSPSGPLTVISISDQGKLASSTSTTQIRKALGPSSLANLIKLTVPRRLSLADALLLLAMQILPYFLVVDGTKLIAKTGARLPVANEAIGLTDF